MPRGRPFQKGNRFGAGRRAGVPNKLSLAARQMLEQAATEIGSLERLVAWIKKRPKNEYAFWTQIYVKLLPIQLRGPGSDGEVVVKAKLTMEELKQKLVERGLPPFVFGDDVPVVPELEAEQSTETEQ
jgi:hypothetical protein